MVLGWVAYEVLELVAAVTLWTAGAVFGSARYVLFGNQPTRQEIETRQLRDAIDQLTVALQQQHQYHHHHHQQQDYYSDLDEINVVVRERNPGLLA
jgi:hypothetical protein